MKTCHTLLILVIAGLGIQNASATLNYWVNWTGAPAGYTNTTTNGLSYATQATGTLYDPNTSQTINVTYTGEVYSQSQFNVTGTNAVDWFNYPAYLSSSVTTTPPAGNFIALTGYSGLTNTLTFSAPVSNLLLAIGSLGNAGQIGQLNFNQTPVVVSYGAGLYGNGPLYTTNTTSVAGKEGNGMVQFSGTFTSVSWTVPSAEQYMVYNIGVTDTPPGGAVPEPGTWAAAALLAGGAAFMRWRKRGKVS